MVDETPDRPPAAVLIEELSVRRNAVVGLFVGVIVASAIYLRYVALQPETEYAAGLYLALAFVVAASVGALVTILLTAAVAVRLAREG